MLNHPRPISSPAPAHSGFDSFRPLQEEIIRDASDRVCLRSCRARLCFQLPALARPGLTVVISPLISMMYQVDALTASGVPATFNSTLKANEVGARMLALRDGNTTHCTWRRRFDDARFFGKPEGMASESDRD
jgi:ATP-dependent DNA helicase RecQ